MKARNEREARRLAWAVCFDTANRSMRAAGRAAWSLEDRDAGTDAFYAAMAAFGYPQPAN